MKLYDVVTDHKWLSSSEGSWMSLGSIVSSTVEVLIVIIKYVCLGGTYESSQEEKSDTVPGA